MFGKELDVLLETLFEDDFDSDIEDVVVLCGSISPRVFGNCCTYSYASYSG